MTKIAIVYHSGNGHTQRQAEAVKAGAESVAGAEVSFLEVGEAAQQLEFLDTVDAIIFGCPTYMGNVSAGMKAFQEAAVSRWFNRAWQNKIAGAFTNACNLDGDKMTTLIGLFVNAMQQGMIFVGLNQAPGYNEENALTRADGPSANAINRLDASIGAMSSSGLRSVEEMSAGDLESARLYGVRVAEITAQFVRGRA
ncbi:NAD(P)H dehydrogenase (quinone) [Neisseria perflava]|uniref:NAD(P)H-dependent oxidoreductase n=1 Tax=Neisseria perflava TaxID=33053 RepID=UPI0020A0BD87|nr:flavodoxin family protein [Neisseria perflava]MCP1772716.1 NAD(P)H dehydrogenase (quinone) [Neisseria perflava]